MQMPVTACRYFEAQLRIAESPPCKSMSKIQIQHQIFKSGAPSSTSCSPSCKHSLQPSRDAPAAQQLLREVLRACWRCAYTKYIL